MATGHGGKRNGSGRKPSTAAQKTRAIADTEAAAGRITPLEVMLLAMRTHHEAGRTDKAAAIAKDAAPYMHARLSAIEHSGKVGVALEVAEVIVDAPVPADPPADHPSASGPK
ncbi:MAG: hypothetical protein V4597_11505 [Pseudomonadota bacterium]